MQGIENQEIKNKSARSHIELIFILNPVLSATSVVNFLFSRPHTRKPYGNTGFDFALRAARRNRFTMIAATVTAMAMNAA
jgi:hypothetical protein